METMKPTKVEVGQRRQWTTTSATKDPFTVAEGDAGLFTCLYDNKGRYMCGRDEIERESIVLGRPSPAQPLSHGERPVPARGQVWRAVLQKGQDRRDLYNYGAPFTLTEENADGWFDDAQTEEELAYGSYWDYKAFTDGRLEFVSHGEPATPGVASGPIKAHGKENCVHGKKHHCAECDIARAKAKIAIDALTKRTNDALAAAVPRIAVPVEKPRDLTALQPLATFSLPGSFAPQRTAYFTRTPGFGGRGS